MSHLFVDISSHGFGHLAQTAPVLHHLAHLHPGLRLTVRSGLPATRLRLRIHVPFEHIAAASDLGYTMVDALRVDMPATAAAYRKAHEDFPARVAAEAEILRELQADAVFANVSYLPLAGAARAGIPALAMCSLNWADLFQHYFGNAPWAAPIYAEMLAAYRSARFLRTTPGMLMPALDNQAVVGPIAALGHSRAAELHASIGADQTERIVLIALGGIPLRVPIERWPMQPGLQWLVPSDWRVTRADCHAIETLGYPFSDILCSVDAVVTKPGYGTFAEAACGGTPVLYQRRPEWPEQEALIDWLHANARALKIDDTTLQNGALAAPLDALSRMTAPPIPVPDGIEQVARWLSRMLE